MKKKKSSVRLSPDQVQSILVVRLDRMGDLLCTTPMLSAIKHLFPRSHLTLVVSPYTAHLVEGSPVVDEVLVYPRRKYGGTLKERVRFLKTLTARKFDLAFAPKSSLHPTQALLVWLSGAPIRVGREAKYRKRRPLHFCYNVLLPPSQPGTHETEACLELIRTLGLEPPLHPSWAVINPEIQEEMDQILDRMGLAEQYLGGIYFSNQTDSRALPWDKLKDLAFLIQKKFPSLTICGTCCPQDFEPLRKIFPGPVIHTPHMQHLGALFRRLKVIITCDGGPAHLAAALGVPVVVFFPNKLHLKTWHPWSPKQLSLLTQKVETERILEFIEKVLPKDLQNSSP